MHGPPSFRQASLSKQNPIVFVRLGRSSSFMALLDPPTRHACQFARHVGEISVEPRQRS